MVGNMVIVAHFTILSHIRDSAFTLLGFSAGIFEVLHCSESLSADDIVSFSIRREPVSFQDCLYPLIP